MSNINNANQTPSFGNRQIRGKNKRSALGIGVITLVTILVVLLLAAFSVLSLVSARSDLNLSEMATKSTGDYYQADAAATEWYAELDVAVGNLTGPQSGYQNALAQAGYKVSRTADGELRVFKSFTMGTDRQLDVTVAVLDDKTTIIRRWQT